MRTLQTIAALLFSVGMGALAHQAQLRADALRLQLDARRDGRMIPDPSMMRAASMGQQAMLGDLMWIRVALNFADQLDHPDEHGKQFLLASIRAVVRLDPRWRTGYFYGGSMMRLLDDIEGSDEIFTLGMEAKPDDPYFPFSLGMNAWLYRDDAEEAARYLRIAAELPTAPPWYRAASAGFLDRKGQRQTALHYLREEMEHEEEPAAREALLHRYRRIMHDEYSSQLTEAYQAWVAQAGRPPAQLSDLGQLPDDPLGGTWILAPDGVVRSDVEEASITEKTRVHERAMLTRAP